MRPLLAIASLPFLAGCGYIHFGRLPAVSPGSGNAQVLQAYADLRTAHKMLQLEHELARRESDALRTALDHAGAAGSPELATRLNEALRELAALRQAQLQDGSSHPAAPGAAPSPTELAGLEERLATSLRQFTQLQEEHARLRADFDRTRADNTVLAEKLNAALARDERAQVALEQLNLELLAQKEAKARAEQATAAVRAQLSVVLAQNAADPAGNQPTGPTPTLPLSRLQLTKSPPATASATAELRTHPDRLSHPPTPAADPNAPALRVHIVQPGETLEQIARQHLNDPDRWRSIQQANATLLGEGQPLSSGMELVIPAP